MPLKRIIVHTRKVIRTLGSEDPGSYLKTGNPCTDIIIDKMQDTSDKIMRKTNDLLFGKKKHRLKI